MQDKSKARLTIRRFFALFFLSTVIFGIFTDISSGNIEDTLGGSIVGFFIVYLLWRKPKSIKKETKEETISIDNEFNEQTIPPEEELDIYDFSYDPDNTPSQKAKPGNKYNPIKDKESIFSRIFRGRTDRY
tara:strand:+ start:91 stop:483 length:393 start_codon:yes stop_codon:yes gene_type:complete